MEFDRKRDTVTAYVTGELDQCSAPGIRRELDQLIFDPSVRRLVLDLKGMRFMDSSGIGVILGRYRVLARRGGSGAVKNMNAHVEKIFYLSGMNQIIQII